MSRTGTDDDAGALAGTDGYVHARTATRSLRAPKRRASEWLAAMHAQTADRTAETKAFAHHLTEIPAFNGVTEA
jgi:hypothetical protein